MIIKTNETVFRGHPDKIADQISDKILTEALKNDPYSLVAIETMVANNKVFIGGEITTEAPLEYEEIAKEVIGDIGYKTDRIEVITELSTQSSEIYSQIFNGGAGDNGIMYGYACKGGQNIPQTQFILQELAKRYDELRKEKPETFFPDGKAQITARYNNKNTPVEILELSVNYNANLNSKNKTPRHILKREYDDTISELVNQVIKESNKIYNNQLNLDFDPITQVFHLGGPEADTGLTGRKLLIDNYHTFSKVGGGAFSGKDPTKTDRTGAYLARLLARDALERFDLDEAEVEISYIIGLRQPSSIYVIGTKGEKREILPTPIEYMEVSTLPFFINKAELSKIDYYKTAQFGHFGNNFIWDKITLKEVMK